MLPPAAAATRGRSFLLDRGTDRQEEVTYLDQAAKPFDFGWPYREGAYQRVANPPPATYAPSLVYDRGDGFLAGKGLTGGAFYSGPIVSLAGKVLLTDEVGKIFAFPASLLGDDILHRSGEIENRTADFAPASGTIERPVAIIRDNAGGLLVLDGDGELYAG